MARRPRLPWVSVKGSRRAMRTRWDGWKNDRWLPTWRRRLRAEAQQDRAELRADA